MPAHTARLALLLGIAGSAVCPSGNIAADDGETYELDYLIELVPEDGIAEVRVVLGEDAELVREIRFHIEPQRHRGFSGDGEIDVDGEYVRWLPPEDGGSIEFEADIDHERGTGSYDALMTDEWALFRGDDVVPPARVRTAAGAESDARLKLTAPDGWSVVTPYPGLDDGWVRVEHSDRRFDRPTGWMTAGNLGVRRERIRGVEVAVAGPVGHGIRRMDILAFLNWNLPELLRVFDDFHEVFLVVSAGDPMWRGGLSGPASIFLHADRPLISENGTSTLMHELMHAALRAGAEPGDDWIVEGLAEFYALELMRRSGTISEDRYERAYEQLSEWSEDADDLDAGRSKGAITARAVLVMRGLDEEIRDETDGDESLDDVVREIAESEQPVDLERLREIAEEVAGDTVEALTADELPGI
ncbi:MAG: hypothetical protein ACREVN_05880 [Gammaproteobacteria bacterium]